LRASEKQDPYDFFQCANIIFANAAFLQGKFAAKAKQKPCKALFPWAFPVSQCFFGVPADANACLACANCGRIIKGCQAEWISAFRVRCLQSYHFRKEGSWMAPTDKRLVRDIGFALVLKLALITLLWWCFFRGAAVSVDDGQMAMHIGAPAAAEAAGNAAGQGGAQ
jgi:hypothetical protein